MQNSTQTFDNAPALVPNIPPALLSAFKRFIASMIDELAKLPPSAFIP